MAQIQQKHKIGMTFQSDNYARDIAGQEGAWLVANAGRLEIVNTQDGHSIRDTMSLGVIPGVVVQPQAGRQSYMVTKISDTPLSLEEAQLFQQQQEGQSQQRSNR